MKSHSLPDRPGVPGEGHSEALSLDQILPRVRTGDPDACGALYSLTNKGVRLILRRHLGHDDVETILQEVYAELFRGIRVGLVPNPDSLGSFLRDIVHAHIAHALPADAPPDPPQEHVVRMRSMLARLSRSARGMLSSYILGGRPQEEICQESRISHEQFRDTLTRAKAMFSHDAESESNQNAAGA